MMPSSSLSKLASRRLLHLHRHGHATAILGRTGVAPVVSASFSTSDAARSLSTRPHKERLLKGTGLSCSSSGLGVASTASGVPVPLKDLYVNMASRPFGSMGCDYGMGESGDPKSASKNNTRNQFLSTLRVDDDDDEDDEMDIVMSEEVAGTVGSVKDSELWRANLGREDDSWLHGERSEDWYTGVKPIYGECPGIDAPGGAITSLAMPSLKPSPNVNRRQVAQDYFENGWALYELLFASLKGEEYFYRPPNHGLRHPQIFYYGHTACLYVNKLRVAGLLDGPVNEYFESIFEVGVDEMTWDDMHKNDMIWPTVSEVHTYRQQVYDVVSNLIQTHPELAEDSTTTITWDHPLWALYMGFEHERIHFETSAVLIREAPIHLVQQPHSSAWPPLHPSATNENKNNSPVRGHDYPATNPMLAVEEQQVTLGKPRAYPSYGWDNAYGTRALNVPAFEASQNLISNGEYLEFVSDPKGYQNADHWSTDGWAWRTFRNHKYPAFWTAAGPSGSHLYKLRTMYEEIDMPWDWPAEVTHHEAVAYCNWKSSKSGEESPSSNYRLPTEAEHQLLRPASSRPQALKQESSSQSANTSSTMTMDPVMLHDGRDLVTNNASNSNLAYSSPSPVGSVNISSQEQQQESGDDNRFEDGMGNVWEHVMDHFNPLEEGLVSFDGFQHKCDYEIHPVYDDFSTPCYDGRHHMIMGGSHMSTGEMASAFARFHFRPHFLQFSGFRMVNSSADVPPVTLLNDQHGSFHTHHKVEAEDKNSSNDNAVSENVYETKTLVDQYLGLHYSQNSGRTEGLHERLEQSNIQQALPSNLDRFPQRVAELLLSLDSEHNHSLSNNGADARRVLDLGCSVGGTSFTLAASPHYDEVVGLDFSQAFVDAANGMKDSASADTVFDMALEGEHSLSIVARHENNVTPEVMQKVTFAQGDACDLLDHPLIANTSNEHNKFNAIVAANLLCRLPKPRACLDALGELTKPGGLVLFTTPYTWLEEFTPREEWLGNSEDGTGSAEVLKEEMTKRGFELVHMQAIPLTIREHARKYQLIVADATVWRKL